jgi:glycosyltransferase involved in cell wall biosynthesis
MRVLHVTQPTTAGVAVCVRLLARAQEAEGWSVAVACPEEGQLSDWLRDDDVEWLRWAASRSPGVGLIGEVRELASLVERWDPDVVYLHSSKAGLAGRLSVRRRRPTVFHPNGWSFLPPGPQRPVALRWERQASQWTDLVVAASEREAFQGRRAGVRAPLLVAANGVDTTRFRPPDGLTRDRLRADLGLGAGPVVVCVGRLCEQKGQDLLLGLWPRVRAVVPDASLVLVGDGPWRSWLEHLADRGVRFAGFQADIRPWLTVADLVVQPSRWEGLSFSVLEALAMGRSVVAFDVAGMAEAIGDEAGAVVAPGDLEGFAAAMVDRLRVQDRRAREGEAARARVELRFDARRFTAQVGRELGRRWGTGAPAGDTAEFDRAG